MSPKAPTGRKRGKREPWTDAEDEAIVRDYFEMLQLEQRGERYNKAAHRRRLAESVERGDHAMQYKSRNISAILVELGMPFIQGYKPLRRYQAALATAVDAHLQQAGHLHGFLVGEDRPDPSSSESDEFPLTAEQIRIEDPPDPAEVSTDERMRRVVRIHDPAMRDARNRRLGTAGERLVLRHERHRLRAASLDHFAERVRWIAREEGDGAGFDILSFDSDGRERWLEVKTTTGPSTTPFFLTENEHRVSEENKDRYRLVRLYDFRTAPSAYCLRPPLRDHLRLDLACYRAHLKEAPPTVREIVPRTAMTPPPKSRSPELTDPGNRVTASACRAEGDCGSPKADPRRPNPH